MFKNLNLNNGAGGVAREAPPPAPLFTFFVNYTLAVYTFILYVKFLYVGKHYTFWRYTLGSIIRWEA
jgi:hypothetical protein